MKVMPGVLGQVGQDVADNLFEIGQSAVKSTADVVADVAAESFEQITTSPQQVTTTDDRVGAENKNKQQEEKAEAEKRRFEEVKAEMARYIQRKRELDQKIAKEQLELQKQEVRKDTLIKQKKDNWWSQVINRSQTSTEKGRLSE